MNIAELERLNRIIKSVAMTLGIEIEVAKANQDYTWLQVVMPLVQSLGAEIIRFPVEIIHGPKDPSYSEADIAEQIKDGFWRHQRLATEMCYGLFEGHRFSKDLKK